MNNLLSAISSLEINSYIVNIKFTRDIIFDKFHGRKLYDLMCKAIAENKFKLGNDKMIDVIESDKCNYSTGEFYRFGLIKLFPEHDYKAFLSKKLDSLGNYNRKNDSLWGCFELIGINEAELTIPQMPEQFDKIILEFLTPTRVIRSEENRVTGHQYCDPEYFDIKNFLKLLYNRVLQASGKKKEYLNNYETSLEIEKNNLFWEDVKYADKTLGGVKGKILLKGNLTKVDQLILWLGETLRAGNNTSHGFGKFKVNYVTNQLYKKLKS